MNKYVVIHELSHIYDTHNSDLSLREDFSELNKLGSFHDLLSAVYVRTADIHEIWAIQSTTYWTEPELTAQICPEVYDYFDNIFREREDVIKRI